MISPWLAARAEKTWTYAAWLALALAATVMFATVGEYGLTWDEEVQRIYGDHVIAWYSSGFRNRSALDYYNLYFYGGFFDMLGQLFVRLSPLCLYESRHLINIAFGWLALLGTFRLARLIAGPRAAFMALILVALTPMFYGHAFNNPKDIPFATLFVWSLYYLVLSARSLPVLHAPTLMKLAVALGLMLGTRAGGSFFIGYIALLWAATLAIGLREVPRAEWAHHFTRAFKKPALALSAILAVAWLLMLIFWPWAQVSPILHPLQAIYYSSRFSFARDVLFNGHMVPARKVPPSYLPVWFAISLPETYFVAWIATLVAVLFVRRGAVHTSTRERLELGFMGFVVAFPVLAAITLRSTLYDAVRHFLFIIPPLATLSAAALERTWRAVSPRPLRTAAGVALAATALLTARDMVQLHPYESVFFNRIIGGLRGAAGRFETDYWGNSYREAVEWVLRNVPGDQLRVANCSSPFLSSYFIRGPGAERLIPVDDAENSDILLATTRWNCHTKLGARVLHTVERQGVALAYVLDMRPSQAHNGSSMR